MPTGAKPAGGLRPNRSPDLEASLLIVPGGSEVPEAVRDANQAPRSPDANANGGWLRWAVGGVAGSIALTVGSMGYLWSMRQLPPPIQTQIDRLANRPPSPTPSASPTSDPNALLGHLPYKEAPRSELRSISNNGQMLLRKSAARAFREMQSAAWADGVNLAVLSAFRSVEQQQSVFFNVKAERNQAATKRAEVSAPPGYSEHHTGYAIDLGDAKVPSANLNQGFERTKAFRWLADNAARFNFELSFPEGNRQGVSYEPWHWRFVGDRDSLETFYKARQQGEANPDSIDGPTNADPAAPGPDSSPATTTGTDAEASPESSPESSPEFSSEPSRDGRDASDDSSGDRSPLRDRF
ncbi:MAG: D-alanyl-D-alanine carboxypeptidase family protein [Oscillatoriales cyanobacterium]|nr:MAG: D-alanyl-D-alanine carboxypeptidase family protein [Oscillatoriales cyanobacterium]